MKKLVAAFLIAAACAAPVANAHAGDVRDVSYRGNPYFQPYRTYSYVSPPTVYYLPNGSVLVERHVVRPAPKPMFRSSRYYDRRDNHWGPHYWNNGHHHDRRHDDNRRGRHR